MLVLLLLAILSACGGSDIPRWKRGLPPLEVASWQRPAAGAAAPPAEPVSAHEHLRHARRHTRRGRHDLARSSYDDALNATPSMWEARFGLGEVHRAERDHAAAAAHYEAASAHEGAPLRLRAEAAYHAATARSELGHARHAERHHTALDKLARRALDQHDGVVVGPADPRSRAYLVHLRAQSRVGLGRAALERGRLEWAAALFEEATDLDPELPSAHAYLGRTRVSQGRAGDAVAHLRAALLLPDLGHHGRGGTRAHLETLLDFAERRHMDPTSVHPKAEAQGRALDESESSGGWSAVERDVGTSGEPIDVRSGLSEAEFLDEYASRHRPVLLRSLALEWSARQRWQRPELERRLGERHVTVVRSSRLDDLHEAVAAHHFEKRYVHGHHPGVKGGEAANATVERATLSQFLADMGAVEPGQDSRYVFGGLGAELLRDDYELPPMFRQFRWVHAAKQWTAEAEARRTHSARLKGARRRLERASFFYVGPPGSSTNFHVHEAAMNGLVYGKKVWTLLPPLSALHLNASVSPLQWHRARPEGASGAYSCVQHAGDVLYIPSFWWHQALNVRESIGMSVTLGAPPKSGRTHTDRAAKHTEEL